MKLKIFLGIFVAVFAFTFFSWKADSAHAAVQLGVEFSNREGFIPLKVYYYFEWASSSNGPWNRLTPASGELDTPQIAAGSAIPVWASDSINHSNYRVIWRTYCADPATSLYPIVRRPGPYLALPRIHAENPCGEPVITTIQCPSPGTTLSFSWKMAGRAAGLPYSVSQYHLFRSQAPDTNPDNNYIGPVPA